MEAAPRLPMISFELLSCSEAVQFGKKLKPYIASFYNEDPEAYNAEISNLDSLRVSITHPSPDISGILLLKKYYCQLHFLKSRFPMEHDQPCFMEFDWKDCQNGATSGGINFELMAVMYNIGALHTVLGAQDSRSSPDGMKLACSHFQCAAWAFQVLKDKYSDALAYVTSFEVAHFYKQVCLAQAQECILEKSMLDNRKSTIISKVAVQVWDFYRQSLSYFKGINEDIFGRTRYKDWTRYIQFKIAYHRCISLLFQGQQAEELQKMGERVAFYQAACDNLEEARKYLSSKQQKELADALAFTADVVEGKRKAAKNENEFIYHEEVPDVSNLQEVKGASLVKLMEFNVNDPEVSGPDIFARLVPMEAHEAASLYSEKKAQLLRNMGMQMEIKDQALAEFMSSMQLELLTRMHQATGIPQDLIDRAAALSAKPTAIKDLVDSMAKLSNIFHDVEANLKDIEVLLKEEEENEKSYQEIMGKRPPSIITTDLAREASKYKEAHTKANDSNETLHKAMMTHLENLKILQTPIRELQQKLPSVELPDDNIDQNVLRELEMLNSKVDEMKTQRAMLWAQLRDSVHNDDITNALVTKAPNLSLDELFTKELEKHNQLVNLLEQNLSAQDNIKQAFIDCYARAVHTRRYIQDIIQKRNSTIQALISSHDSYDDLLGKANKGIEFYTKLEMNVSKLFQRIKSASKVQQEEREQMLAKNGSKKDEIKIPTTTVASTGPKLKDYLEARKKANSMSPYPTINYGGLSQNIPDSQNWPPSIRPAPVGSEVNADPAVRISNEATNSYYQQMNQSFGQISQPHQNLPGIQNNNVAVSTSMTDLTGRMSALLGKQQTHYSVPVSSSYNTQYSYSSYTPQNYTPVSYAHTSQHYTDVQPVQTAVQDASKAATVTTNSYHTISSYIPNVPHNISDLSHAAYTESTPRNFAVDSGYGGSYQYSAQAANYNQTYPQQSGSQTNIQCDTTQVRDQNPSQPSTTQASGQQLGQGQYPQFQNSSQYPQYPQSQTPVYSSQSEAPKYLQSQHPLQYSQTVPTSTHQQQFQPQNTSATYMQGYYIGTQQPNVASSTYGLDSQVSGQVGQLYGTTNQIHGTSSQQNVGASDSAPQTGSASTQLHKTNSQHQNIASYAQGHQTTESNTPQQNYYPYGYAPNYNNPLDTASQNIYGMTQYQQRYYTHEHASSVNSNEISSYSTYTAPGSDVYKLQSGTATAYNISTGVSQHPTSTTSTPTSGANTGIYQTGTYNPYGSIYGYNQPNYVSTASTVSYTSPTSTPQIASVAPQTFVSTTKESNIDLLTGLDFSASQIPTLTPQQNIVPDKPKESEDKPTTATVEIKPAVAVQKVKEEACKSDIRVLPSKPLSNSEIKSLFTQEVEKYEKYVETLTNKTLSGPTTLDVKWKEIQDSQELDNQKRVISVARCYPMKNRFADILPYDYSRIELKSVSDDYINASLIQQLSPFTPQFIVTQAPLATTYGDFWTMVREQQVELIFCLLNDKEIQSDVYWPKEKGKTLSILNMVLSLQSIIIKPNWIERLILISIPEKKESCVVMHLQFTSWPGSLFPTSPEPFVSYILELISLFQQQKCTSHPIVVHCASGIGRSGLTCLLTDAILNVTNQANAIPDLAALTTKLSNFRKNILRDREHLKFAYEAMLCYVKQVLLQDNMKKKLSEVIPVKEEDSKATEMQDKIIDPLSTLDPFWASKK